MVLLCYNWAQATTRQTHMHIHPDRQTNSRHTNFGGLLHWRLEKWGPFALAQALLAPNKGKPLLVSPDTNIEYVPRVSRDTSI